MLSSSTGRERPYHNLPDQDIYSDPPFRAGISFSSLSRSDRPFRLSCIARVVASGGMPGPLAKSVEEMPDLVNSEPSSLGHIDDR